MERVRVLVRAADPVTVAGLKCCIESTARTGGPVIEVRTADRGADADVVVVAIDQLTREVVTGLRRAAMTATTPVVLVVPEITEAELLTAVECRVVAVLLRAAATRGQLVRSVLEAASGNGVLPPDLLGMLLKQVERLRQQAAASRGAHGPALTPREVEVLRLLADGLDTAEIAGELCYSERTVKNVVSAVTTRLNLRNRPHAVAYAMRTGMI